MSLPASQPSLFAGEYSGKYAEIVFDRPLDHSYTYAIPKDLEAEVGIGKRVLAPFGRGDRGAIGYCVGITGDPPAREVKSILQVLDDHALLTPSLLRLTRWMADYYLVPWGQLLGAVVPAGVKHRAGTRNIVMVELVPENLLPHPRPPLSKKQESILQHLRESGQPLEMRCLGQIANCGPGPIKALVDKNFLQKRLERIETWREQEEESPPSAPATPSDSPYELTPDQAQVWKVLEEALDTGGFRPCLLHGVTGSGKTELYLRAIQKVVQRGKEALVLVPEISLTPQTIQSFKGRCGDIAVLHSHLHSAERGGYWRRIARGHVQVIVGARSAIFAPTRNLGLIVIDEEHEASFKQESTPRYHARDVAVMRARIENIPILLGSATPSLESWHNARKGQYTLLSLPRRVFDRPLPPVHLVDLRFDRRGDSRLHGLSPTLERAMAAALKHQGQVLLLLNRRGYSTYIHCPSCGFVEQCKFCDLAMTYHKERDILLCHTCGYEQPPTVPCPECGIPQVRYQGLGTEKLQVEIQTKFPQHHVERMDSDTMRKPGSHKKVLDAFRRGEIHILMGTQMIAKGLDFPNVTVVGVINADVGLHRADFRASERTFQLLAQVAGRTGRGNQVGRVFVQTYHPEHPSISLAAKHDFLGFAEAELKIREEHHYPPFHRLARLLLRSKDSQKAADTAERLAGAFRVVLERSPQAGDLRLLGPAEASVFRIKGYFRFHFQLQSSSSAFLHQVLRQVIPSVRMPAGVELTVDIDPQDMM